MKKLRFSHLLLVLSLTAPVAYSSTAIVSFTNNSLAGHGNYDRPDTNSVPVRQSTLHRSAST